MALDLESVARRAAIASGEYAGRVLLTVAERDELVGRACVLLEFVESESAESDREKLRRSEAAVMGTDLDGIRASVAAEWAAGTSPDVLAATVLTLADLDWVVGRAETLRELIGAGHVDDETVEAVEEAAAARSLL